MKQTQNKILIFGNSGAGKSSLAKHLAARRKLPHLDLDTLAWDPAQAGSRRPLAESEKLIGAFVDENSGWIIEGCHASLLELIAPACSEMIFLNPGVAVCQENNRQRPWEAHKYSSPDAQNKNLAMLLAWVAEYETRDDEYSYTAHKTLFNAFKGDKKEIRDQSTLDIF